VFKDGTKGQEFEKGIGTGGYILEQWEPGVTAITRRNPNYWKEGRAHFDKVETLSINDVNARTNAVKTGQIHFMDRCERKTVQPPKKVKRHRGYCGDGDIPLHHAHANPDETL
jgi:peptide/nickel transport system substrate-binding protein